MRISDWSSDVCSSDLSIRAPVKSRAPSGGTISVIRCDGVEIHRSARRHGVSDADILHPVDHPLVVVDVDPDADPPKVLVIGPDLSSNLLDRKSVVYGKSVSVRVARGGSRIIKK